MGEGLAEDEVEVNIGGGGKRRNKDRSVRAGGCRRCLRD